MARKGGKDRGLTQRQDRTGWWVKLYVNGRRHSFKCDTKSQAAALYGRLKAEQREGKYFTKPKALPFQEIAREYVQAVDARRRRKGDDAARMHRWITAFGDQDALTISPRQIERVLSDLQAEGKQPATLVRHLAVLKATFNRAKRLGLMKENPATLVKPPKVNNMLVRYVTAEQESRLLEQLPLQYRPVVQTAINTGLRQGELLRLTWSDIDWNAGILTVQETKAGDTRRMPMNSTVLGVLTGLRVRCATQPTDHVFPHGARYLRRAFERAVNAAELRPFRFHDLRHTFASRLAMRGENDRTLMALGGWKSPAMLSRYAHLSPAHLFHAVEGLTRMGTAPKTVTEESTDEEHTSILLEEVVSRLGLEPRTLALKVQIGGL
jgi:integrase